MAVPQLYQVGSGLTLWRLQPHKCDLFTHGDVPPYMSLFHGRWLYRIADCTPTTTHVCYGLAGCLVWVSSMDVCCLPCCNVSERPPAAIHVRFLLPVPWHLQLRRACSKANNELAAVSEDRANLHEQHQKAQESIDALVAELQDTLARLEQEQKQAGLLSDKLQQSSADAAAKQKQVRLCYVGGCACGVTTASTSTGAVPAGSSSFKHCCSLAGDACSSYQTSCP